MAQVFRGMDELIRGMEELPDTLQRQADAISAKYAEAMAQSLRAQYPVVTGNLRGHVTTRTKDTGVYQVRSTARHAWIYERGTVDRITDNRAERGRMPKTNVFVRTAIRWRREMEQRQIDMLRRQTVRGMTGTLMVTDRALGQTGGN